MATNVIGNSLEKYLQIMKISKNESLQNLPGINKK